MRFFNIAPWDLAVALTFLKGGKRRILGTVTVISVIGIGVGVATLIGVLGVTTGFQIAIRDHILGMYPHLIVIKNGGSYKNYVSDMQKIKKIKGVIDATPTTYDEMLLSASNGTQGVNVTGKLMDEEFTKRLYHFLKKGSVKSIRYDPTKQLQGIITGCTLAKKIGLKVGDVVSLTNPIRGLGDDGVGPLGMMPVEQKFIYSGCIKVGFYELDTKLVLMDLKTAQKFLNRGNTIRWLEVRIKDFMATDQYKRRILGVLSNYDVNKLIKSSLILKASFEHRVKTKRLKISNIVELVDIAGNLKDELAYDQSIPPLYSAAYRIMDWKDLNHNLFAALKLQRTVLAIFFLIIVVVAGFNVIGTQMMIQKEKSSDIAILNTMGAGHLGIFRVFLWHGAVISIIGIASGIITGLLVVKAIASYKLQLDPSVYMISTLPAMVHSTDILLIASVAFILIMVSCTLNGLRISHQNLIAGLRRM